MSVSDIISELPKLTPAELGVVDAKLHQLLGRPSVRHWGDALAEFTGAVAELPADYALNHDHYLHQVPKQ